MKIDLHELKSVTNRLLDHVIETRGVAEVELPDRLYWAIPPGDRYCVDEDPNHLEIGSIRDNWELISHLLNADEEPVAYQLTELAPILEYIGEVLGEALATKGG